MANLVGTVVANNYLKTKPSTQFGTRELKFIAVTAGNAGSNDIDFTKQKWDVTLDTPAMAGSYTDGNSFYSAAVRALQTVAEVYAVLTPSATSFVVVIADDTANSSEVGSNVQAGTWGDAEAAVLDAVKAIVAKGTAETPLYYDGAITVTVATWEGTTATFA